MAKKKEAVEETAVVPAAPSGINRYNDTHNFGLSIPGTENGALQKRIYDDSEAEGLKQAADDLKGKVKSTKQAYKSIVSMARSEGKVHEAFRNAQGDIAEVAADMATVDAKTAKRVGKSAVTHAKGIGEASAANHQAEQEIAALPSGNFMSFFKGF